MQKHQGLVCLLLYSEQTQVGICQSCVYVCISLDVAIGATASHQTWSLLMASLSEHTHPDNVDPTGDM